jgi:UDP-N-acetylmuramyl pentapeptide phosphotransferase/UDP-N-acetylglucosamine-1-phosphate transferase
MIANINVWAAAKPLGTVLVVAAAICVALILWLRPLLLRYALARPNARSSHRKPTPQGGGIAVIGAAAVAIAGAAIFAPGLFNNPFRLVTIIVPVVALAIVGAADDIHPLSALSRLLFQTLAVLIVVATLPVDVRIFHPFPWWLERILLIFAILWFVNLVNFMDGIDWMSVAEVIPLTAGLGLFGLMGALPPDAMVVAIALCGAIIGFAPFNRPVARLFLGDVGSLPIGLLLGWLLVLLTGRGHLTAALLLPLYYVADSTITLLRRLVNGEQVMLAHRDHFYQRALDGGLSVYRIVGSVFGLNIFLLILAAATLASASPVLHLLALIAGGSAVGALLWHFNSARR